MNTVIPVRGLIAPALLVLFAACDGGGTESEPPGSVQLTASTTGRALDRDGYSVSVDGGTAVPLQTNGTATIGSLTPGSHTLVISGVAPNCTLDGGASRTVTVQPQAAAPVTIAVQCVGDRYAYIRGLGTGGLGLFMAKVDGTEAVELKRMVRNGRLSWRPDGSSLLYVRVESHPSGDPVSSIWSVDVITRDSVLVAGTLGMNVDPQWSPPGDRIAFAFSPLSGMAVPSRLIIMNADGSGRRGVTGYTGNGYESMPTWSPDGNQLAYRRGSELRVVNADGTGDRLVTDLGTEDYTQMAWSPDGAWIVWSARNPDTATGDLYRVRPDGTGRAAITETTVIWEQYPSFMADGRIVFTATPQGGVINDPWAIAVDGSGRTNLLTTPQVGELVVAWQ